MRNFDYYNKAKELAALLSAEGKKEYTDVLCRSIEEGTTATEILMALKYHLSLIVELKNVSDICNRQAKYLLNEVKKALEQ